MKFSVTIPAYKPEYLREAVASVLGQTYLDWELIIVDDCSPSDLQSIVEPFLLDNRVRYYRNDKNFGALNVVDNWNRCLSYCSGDYVICMGDDDCLLPECLEELSSLICRFPNLGVYHSRTVIIDNEGKEIITLPERPEFETSLQMLLGRCNGRYQYIGDFCFSVPLLRTNGGFYKLPLAWGSDDISVYISAKGDEKEFIDGIANSNLPSFCYRRTPQTISSNHAYKLKLRAVLESVDWFKTELANRRDICKDEELSYLDEVSSALVAHYRVCSESCVRGDVRHNKKNFKYWILNYRLTRLSFVDVLFQCLIGLVQRD